MASAIICNDVPLTPWSANSTIAASRMRVWAALWPAASDCVPPGTVAALAFTIDEDSRSTINPVPPNHRRLVPTNREPVSTWIIRRMGGTDPRTSQAAIDREIFDALPSRWPIGNRIDGAVRKGFTHVGPRHTRYPRFTTTARRGPGCRARRRAGALRWGFLAMRCDDGEVI